MHARAAGVQIPHDVTHVGLRDGDPQLHDGFQHHRSRITHGDLEGLAAGGFKRDGLGVHRVFLTVRYGHLYLFYGMPREHAPHHDLLHALFYGRHEAGRNAAPDDFAYKLEFGAFMRLDPHVNLGELSRSAGLLLVAILRTSDLGNGLPIGNLRYLHLKSDLEFRLGLPDGDVDVLIAHSLQDGLVCAGLLVPG